MKHISAPHRTKATMLLGYRAAALLAITLAHTACVATQAPSNALSMEELERRRHQIALIEKEARDIDHEERISRAQANELATRHAPSSVSTTTVFAPRF